ncbi:MAG: tagatose-6-phosphate ketose isomerase [Acidobacteria bacterium]|nr:MAG: tagatose-6-phosphate ketose isomerase [Acidobacteriota bacterium]
MLTLALENYLNEKSEFKTALTRLIHQPEAIRKRRGTLHTPKEILQQPWTWLETAQRISLQAPQLKVFLRKAGLTHKSTAQRARLILAGAGTSDYVGKSLIFCLRRRLQTEVLAIPSTDILTNFSDVFLPQFRYLLISFSRSGESPEGVKAIEIARRRFPGVSHLIITCNAHGTMARAAVGQPDTYTLGLHESVHDQGLAMTSSYSNMVLAGLGLGYLDELGSYLHQAKLLSRAGENILSQYADLANQLAMQGFKRYCFLGTGNLSGAALEAQLKLRELTDGKLVTLSESFLGVRHGPLSALDRHSLLVGFLSNSLQKQKYELDLLREIRTKRIGSTQCVLCEKIPKRQQPLAHHWIEFGSVQSSNLLDEFRPPLDILFPQMLGLFSSLHYRLQPDQPSARGVIGRVVQGVKVYEEGV